jgi:hypothetical protein
MTRCSLTEDEQWKIGLLKTVNHTLYHKFVARASHLLEPLERNKWGMVFSMRHHGFLTRLLDWSESFACALHFALSERQPDQEAAVYLLNPQFLNEITCGRKSLVTLHSVESRPSTIEQDLGPSTIDPDLWHPAFSTNMPLPTIAVAPVFTNRRMIAQKCAFTISGDSFQSLEAQFPTCVRKVVLPANISNDAQKFLDLAGASHFGYFPDLEGLRREFNEMLEREVQEMLRYRAEGSIEGRDRPG